MVYVKEYDAPLVEQAEILRYARCKESASELIAQMQTCLSEVWNHLQYKVCYIRLPIQKENEMLNLSFATTDSKALTKNLEGCTEIILFAATIGLGIDRFITRYSKLSPSKALWLQAIGTERIEALCDTFCADMAKQLQTEEKKLHTRFSPGYGDLALTLQKDVFRVLDCPRKIGVSLNESLLMSPSKSVTAIMGISQSCITKEMSKPFCQNCNQVDCTYRK